MAWSSIATLGSANDKTAGTTIAMTTSATAEAGNVIIVLVGTDNTATADGASTTITVADSTGANTYTRAIEETETQGGAAADGATVGIFYSVLASELASGGTITATFSSLTASAITAWEFSFGAGSTITVAGSTGGGDSNADAPAITIASLTSAEYLWVHAFAQEDDQASFTYTQDADYTSFTADGTTGGGAGTNIVIRGGHRIFTGTTDTVDVTNGTGLARSWRQVYVALLEDAGATTTNVDIIATASVSAILVKSAALTRGVTTVGVADDTMQVGKILTAGATGSATITVMRVIIVELIAAATVVAAVVKSAGLNATTTVLGIAGTVMSVGKQLSADAMGTANRVLSVGKILTTSATGTADVVATFVSGVVTAATGRLVGLIRGMGKIGRP